MLRADLLLQRHHQDAPHLQQVLHVLLVFLLHPGATVDPVIVAALRGDLQAVTHHKGRLTELKPEKKMNKKKQKYINFWEKSPQKIMKKHIINGTSTSTTRHRRKGKYQNAATT